MKMKRFKTPILFLLTGILGLCLGGCRENLIPLQVGYECRGSAVLFSVQGEEIANLLYTATDGVVFSERTGDGGEETAVGAVTVSYGEPVLWQSEDPGSASTDTSVQLTITAFDQQGRQLAVQHVNLYWDNGHWMVAEEANVSPLSEGSPLS